jgi:diguanylate cyclase (GGDEF)-like protein
MADSDIGKQVTGQMKKLRFLRGSLHLILAWPFILALITLVLWGVTLSKLRNERSALETHAFKNAITLSENYAEHLARAVGQVDQITLTLKYYWQDTNGQLSLEAQSKQGLYPGSTLLHVTIVDKDGFMRTSTTERSSRSIADSDFFQALKNDPSKGLIISKPAVGIFSEKMVIHFSRSLLAEDGAFDGLIIVAAEPDYLAAFYDDSQMGKDAFLTVRSKDGDMVSAKTGEGNRLLPTVFRAPPAFESHSGITILSKDKFSDGKARIVAWQELDKYPLTSIIGLSEQQTFAVHDEKSTDYRNAAIAASVFLALCSVVGMLFTARLAWRKQQAHEVKATYRMAIEGGREGFYMLHPLYDQDRIVDFLVEDCNERGAVLLNRAKQTLIGTRLSECYSGAHAEHVSGVLCRAMQTGFYEEEFRIPEPDKMPASWVHRKLIRSGTGLAMIVRDISKSKAHEEALSRLANADAVTALPNRHWLMNYLPLSVERAKTTGAVIALLFVDLDDFKNINDTLGHACGDEVLRAVASRLRSVVRPDDKVARLGGDEFTIILEEVEGRHDVSAVANRIIQSLGEPFVLSGGSSHVVHASIGISMCPIDGGDGDTLLKHADIAMYAAKASGKGCFAFYEPYLSENLVVRLNKEQALHKAIEQDEFVLHYQPRVDTFTGELRSIEALVRWTHAQHGLIPPLEFISVAEDTGLIVELGELVIEKACAQLAQWRKQDLPVVPVAINVSPRQFIQGTLSAFFASCMLRYDIDPSFIQIEITESCMMSDDKTVTDELAAIEALGITLFVDDFGTGYSSLSQLQRLDLDGLKVDRAFTAQLCNGREGEVFFMAILSMAHVLGMTVVAEGVESVEQLQMLQKLSCDEVQGYLISRPLPADDVPSLMLKRFLIPQTHQLAYSEQEGLF